MIDETFPEIEELVREISDSPPLSCGLRERIIAESMAALSVDRRETRRHRAIAACGLSLLLGVSFWFQSPMIPASAARLLEVNTPSPDATGGRIAQADPSADGLSALMAMSEIGDWGHVEAVTRLREMHRQTLGMFSGF